MLRGVQGRGRETWVLTLLGSLVFICTRLFKKKMHSLQDKGVRDPVLLSWRGVAFQ